MTTMAIHLYIDRNGLYRASVGDPCSKVDVGGHAIAALALAAVAERIQLTDSHPRAAQERVAVGRLCALILAKLAERRHHGDWREQGAVQLMRHLRAEWEEMRQEWLGGTDPSLIAELVDVAGVCALLIDVLSPKEPG